MTIERIPTSELAPMKGLKYEDVQDLHGLYDALAFNTNLILSGPKGIGKSLSVADYAAKIDCPIITFDCSEDARRSHLIGMFVLRGTETPFVLGPITTAFEVANEVGKVILLFEEINALSPQCQKLMNPIADFRRRVAVPEAKKVFELKDNCHIWLVGTMNSSVYGGVYELNEDLKSRFVPVPLEYPPMARERQILKKVLNGGAKLDKATIDAVLRLAHETRQGQFDYALSTRDVVQIINNISRLGVKKALWVATGKFEDKDRPNIKERITSIFSVDV